MTPSGDGGLNKPVEVRWKIASDAAMVHVVRTGQATAHPRFAHSVHVEVSGLQPGVRIGISSRARGRKALSVRPALRRWQARWSRRGSASCRARTGKQGTLAPIDTAAERPDLVFFLATTSMR